MVSPLLFLALACSGGDEPAPAAQDDTIAQMGAARLLNRVSLDLRGTRPTLDELDRVESDPDAIGDVIDEIIRDDRFGARVRSLYSEIYLTEADYFMVSANQFGIDDGAAFLRAVGQEPLRLIEHIASTDQPWTDLVTADYTVANEVVAEMFPTDYPDGGTGWQVARYTDGRPAAGVLSTTGMWLRYTSTDSNANRKRANTVSRVMLCNDYLTRPLEFDREVDLLDTDAVNEALTTNPACVNCHVSLDPMAAYFFGFWSYQINSWLEVSTYHPEREHLYTSYLGVEPSYYGEPGDSLADLGVQIASDPRFAECAVEQVYGQLLQRDVTLADMDALTGHREAFLAGGLTMRALVRSVLDDPRYQAALSSEAVGVKPTKMLSPDQLASAVEDLTGFRWTYANYDMMRSDTIGVRTLAGGADGYTVTRNTSSPNTTLVLVNERLAEAAASYVVAEEPQRLFSVDFTETPDSDRDAVVGQIQQLHRRILGRSVAADSEEVAANLELWETLHAIEGEPRAAWAGLTAALLRDPDFLLY